MEVGKQLKVASGVDWEGHQCEVQEEDVAHREATVGGTGNSGRNGETGGDDGKEGGKEVYDDCRNGTRAIDRSAGVLWNRTILEFPGGQDQRVGGTSSEGVGSTTNLFM